MKKKHLLITRIYVNLNAINTALIKSKKKKHLFMTITVPIYICTY